jgi:hypothetical protein
MSQKYFRTFILTCQFYIAARQACLRDFCCKGLIPRLVCNSIFLGATLRSGCANSRPAPPPLSLVCEMCTAGNISLTCNDVLRVEFPQIQPVFVIKCFSIWHTIRRAIYDQFPKSASATRRVSFLFVV